MFEDALAKVPHAGARGPHVCLPHNVIDEAEALAEKAGGGKASGDVAAALSQLRDVKRKFLQRVGLQQVSWRWSNGRGEGRGGREPGTSMENWRLEGEVAERGFL